MQLGKEKPKNRGIVNKSINYVKDFLFPITKKEKTRRNRQLRDVSIFVLSIGALYIFEEKIQKILSVDIAEIEKLTKMQQQMPPAY